MPVKRRVSKRREYEITPELVAMFKRCEQLQEGYRSCSRNGNTCKSEHLNRHCADCREYLDTSVRLHRALGLMPWDAHVSDSSLDGPMPDYMQSGGLMAGKGWEHAQSIRAELIAAAEGKKR